MSGDICNFILNRFKQRKNNGLFSGYKLYQTRTTKITKFLKGPLSQICSRGYILVMP